MASGPTLAGFITFIRQVMGIDTTILPDADTVIPMALAVAMAIVNPALKAVSLPTIDSGGAAISSGPSIYTLAVYNLGGDNIINYAHDQPGAADVVGSDPPMPFFAWTRKQWNINGFVSGVIQSAGDEGTSESMVVQEAAKNFTLANLQQLKTPYGRQYLAFAQSYGPSTWGIT